jgi:hypothetical protein
VTGHLPASSKDGTGSKGGTGGRGRARLGRPDQVVRRMQFSQQHPEVTFVFHRETGRWEATYPAAGEGTLSITRAELKDVLDDLERHFGLLPGQQREDAAKAAHDE